MLFCALWFSDTDCSGNSVSKTTSLAAKAPDIAQEWDYKQNTGSPADYTAYSNYKAKWRCSACGHSWAARIENRVGHGDGDGTGCPECYNLRRSQPRMRHRALADSGHPVMKEWDYELNEQQGLDPHKITLRSNKRCNWICRQCPAGQLHRWKAAPLVRTLQASGCPYCSGLKACKCNSLQALSPEVAAEWDYVKNEGTPDDYPANSHMKAWFLSTKRGSWQAKINNRVQQAKKKAQISKGHADA